MSTPVPSAAARIPCPWWWCAWFRVVLPTIHSHTSQLPPWFRHTVTITPAQAKRVIESVERLESTPHLLPPPDLLENAIRVLYLSELRARNEGKKFGLEDERESASLRLKINAIYDRVAGRRYGSSLEREAFLQRARRGEGS